MPNPSVRNLKDAEFLRDVLTTLNVAVYVLGDNGRFVDANPAFLSLFGFESVKELRAADASQVLKLDLNNLRLDLLHHDRAIHETKIDEKKHDGRSRKILHSITRVNDPEDPAKIYYGLIIDVTAIRQADDPLLDKSYRDTLTGAFNRVFLSEFEKLSLDPKKLWGCVFIYIDHFKQYNDRYGYDAGEEVLQKMSRFLMRHARARDGVIRLSDEEFLVLIQDEDALHTGRVSKRLRTAALGQAPLPFSLGWAVREGEESLEKTILRADQNLAPVRVLFRMPTRRKTVSS